MLRPIEILSGKLADTRRNPLVQPPLLQPPGIKPEGVHARHAAGAGQRTEIGSEVTATLPECSRVEVQIAVSRQRAEIHVHGPAKAIPTRKPFFAVALNVPERITQILEIESDATLKQARPQAAPIAEEMPMRALSSLMNIGPTERLLGQLRLRGNYKRAQGGDNSQDEPCSSTTHRRHA